MRRFQKLPEEQRRIVFFSEGPSGWPHLGPIAQEFLARGHTICWLSSRKDDPGLAIENPNWLRFYIGKGSIRIFTFAAMRCGALITTTPGLNYTEIKRSRFNPLYIYIHHSLVSHHMVYRQHAFAAFDAIFCAGPHHIDELKDEESVYSLPARKKIVHGYARLDALLKQAAKIDNSEKTPCVLVAPSWGNQGLIEGGFAQPLIASLLEQGFQVILRPHPRTYELAVEKIHALTHAFPTLVMDNDIVSDASLMKADVMISDWSGAALEYAFCRKRPVVFMDTARKVNNPDYEKIASTPIMLSIRDKIGIVISTQEPRKAVDTIRNLMDNRAAWEEQIKQVLDQTVFNLGNSAKVACDEILMLVNERKAS